MDASKILAMLVSQCEYVGHGIQVKNTVLTSPRWVRIPRFVTGSEHLTPGAPHVTSLKTFVVCIFCITSFATATAQRSGRESPIGLQDNKQIEVLVAAHRGGYANDKTDRAPENSLANLELAIRKGFDVYETDIQRTSDGIFVIMHDETIERETNGSGRISEMTFAEVRQLRKRFRDGSLSAQRVATLEQLLKAGRGRILFKPDLKRGVVAHFADLATLIHRCGMQDQVFLRTGLGDRKQIAKYFQQGCPKVEVMFKVDAVAQAKSVINEFHPATIQVNLAKGEVVSQDKALAIEYAASQGVLVETHVYSDGKQWDRLAGLGVRMFHTTNPDAVLSHLQKNGWHATSHRHATSAGDDAGEP